MEKHWTYFCRIQIPLRPNVIELFPDFFMNDVLHMQRLIRRNDENIADWRLRNPFPDGFAVRGEIFPFVEMQSFEHDF